MMYYYLEPPGVRKDAKCMHKKFGGWKANTAKTVERRACMQCGMIERKVVETGEITKNYY